MRKIMLAALVAAAALAGYSSTVARVVVCLETKVNIYAVSDEDEWTFEKTIYSQSGGVTPGCLYHQGIIYLGVSAGGGDADSGEVLRYDLSGKQLDSLPTCDFVPWNLAVSPDGRYLFVSNGRGSSASKNNKLYRYDLNRGILGEWVAFAQVSGNCMRAVEVDPNGNVFWASRGSVNYVGNCYCNDNLPIKSFPAAVGGSSANFPCGVRYNAADGYLYFGNSKDKGYSAYGKVLFDNDTKKFGKVTYYSEADYTTQATTLGWNDEVLFVNGKMYMSCNNVEAANVGVFRVTTDEAPKTVSAEQIIGNSTTKTKAYAMELLTTSNTMEFESAYAAELKSSDNSIALWPQGGAIAGTANGISGNCLYFTKTNSTAKFVNAQSAIPKNGDFAVSMWVGLQEGATERLIFSNRNPLLTTDELSLLVDADGKLGLKFNGYDTLVSSSTKRIDDGKWHHVGMVRRGSTAFELYEDGASVGSLTISAADAVENETNPRRSWHIGCNEYEDEGYLGADAFVDCLTIAYGLVGGALPTEDDFATEYAAHSSASAPTAESVPSQPGVRAMPTTAGTEVAHAFACEQSFGSPTLVVIGGTYYLGVSAGEAPHAGCESLRVYYSSNDGTTWNYHSTLKGSGATLVNLNGTLCAIGMLKTGTAEENARKACMWKFDGSQWNVASTNVIATAAGSRFDMQSSQASISPNANNRIYQSAVSRVISSSRLNYKNAIVSFTFSDDGAIKASYGNWEGVMLTDNFGLYDTAVDVLGGVSVVRWKTAKSSDLGVASFLPFVDRRNPNYPYVPLGVERCCSANCSWECGFYDEPKGRATDMFRGGSRPFGIVFDDTLKRYYAVTVAVTNSAELTAVKSPLEVNHSLAVYTSEDLRGWQPAGIISDLGAGAEYGYNGAACALDGDSLLVATVVGADDGAPGFNKLRSNYVSFRKIDGYRTAYQPVEMTNERLYIVDKECNANANSYYRLSDGEWYPAGRPFNCDTTFTYGGKQYSMGAPQGLVSRNEWLYGCSTQNDGNAKPARIYKLTLRGALNDVFVAPSTDYTILNFDVSPDGKFAAVTAYKTGSDISKSGVYKVDFTTREWTQIIQNTNDNKHERSVAIDSHGGIYVGYWNSTAIAHYTNSTDNANSYALRATTSQPSPSHGYVTSLILDEREGHEALYSADLRGRIFKTTITSGETKPTTTIFCKDYTVYHTFANQMTIDPTVGNAGALYVTSRGGSNRSIDLETGKASCPFASMGSSLAIDYIPNILLGTTALQFIIY